MFTHLDDPAPPVPDVRLADAAIAEGRRRLRRRRLAGGSLGAAALALVVAISVFQVRADDPSVVAGSGDDATTFAAPSAGEAVPDELADGTPVWVVGHDDGTVTIVDAASAHRPYGVAQLVGWCAAARGFVDPQYGSQYDEFGLAVAGPAPHGLRAATLEPVNGTVDAAPHELEKRPRRERRPVSVEGADFCLPPGGYKPGFNPRSLMLHDLGGRIPAKSLDDAVADAERGDLLFVDDGTILIRDSGAIACLNTHQMGSLPPECDGVPVQGVEPLPNQSWAVLNGSFLARFDGDSIADIRYINGWIPRTSENHGWSGELIDPDAARWCAPHVGDYGIDADLVAAFPRHDDYEAECWIDGHVAKSPLGGRPFDRAVIAVRANGTADMIRATYRDDPNDLSEAVARAEADARNERAGAASRTAREGREHDESG